MGKQNPILHTQPVYIFDITNRLIHSFDSVAAFYKSDFCKKWFPWAINRTGRTRGAIRISDHRNQCCLHHKFFLTFNKNFIVNLALNNHNPISMAHNLNGELFMNKDYGNTFTNRQTKEARINKAGRDIMSLNDSDAAHDFFLLKNYNELLPTYETMRDQAELDYYENRFFRAKEFKPRN